MRKVRLVLVVLAFVVLGAGSAWAGTLTIPNTFYTGSPAIAGEVNDNFTAVETEVNDNADNIAANAATISNNAAVISSLQNAHSSTRTNYFAINPASCIGEPGTGINYTINPYFIAADQTSSSHLNFYCPVYLPHNSVIKSFTIYWGDTDTTNDVLAYIMVRDGWLPTATATVLPLVIVSSTGSGGLGSTTSSAITSGSPAVDNIGKSYYVRIGVRDFNMEFFGAVITYDYVLN